MPTVSFAPYAVPQFLDNAGQPISGGTLETYLAGTSTPAVTYADGAGAVPNPATIQLDSAGRPSNGGSLVDIRLNVTKSYKFVLKDASGAVVRTVDGVNVSVSADALGDGAVGERAITNDPEEQEAVAQKIGAFTAAAENPAALLALTREFPAGSTIRTADGFVYRVAPPSATDAHVTTAGGVKLYVLPGPGPYNVTAFGAVGDGVTDNTAILERVAAAAGRGAVMFPAGTYVGDMDTAANVSFAPNAFLRGTLSFTGADEIKAGRLRASCIYVLPDATEGFEADDIFVDGSLYTGANGRNGVRTAKEVKSVKIRNLVVTNAGGTVPHADGVDFQGAECDLLQIDTAIITNCAYSGFTYSRWNNGGVVSRWAFRRVVLGTVFVDGCGRTTNPVGDNQHHGCYLSSADALTFDKIMVSNQKRGYGIKFGSSIAQRFGSIIGGSIYIDGVTSGRGGITFTEPVGSFQVSGGCIHGTDTSHIQMINSTPSGSFDFGTMVFSETANVSTSNPSIYVAGDIASLDISRCQFRGWLDGSVRRGIAQAVLVAKGCTVGKFIAHGTVVDTIAGHFLLVEAGTSGGDAGGVINEISVMAPCINAAGGVFNIQHGTSPANVKSGSVSGIHALVGSLTNAWVFPARGRLRLSVTDNTITAGATTVRLNDLRLTRMSNITGFDSTYWVDTATGLPVAPANYDTQFPDESLGDNYIGKVFFTGVWRNFGQIA